MKIEKRLRKLEKEYNKLKSRADYYVNKPEYRHIYLKRKKEEVDVKNKIYRLIVPILEENDIEFKSIANENYEILEIDEFNIKTVEENYSVFGNYATVLEGEINDNGLIYLTTKKSDLGVFNFMSKHEFATRLKGKIDCLGNASVEIVETGFARFKTIPSFFTGQIGKNGEFDIFLEEREVDFLSGKTIMTKLIGNPMINKKGKERKFWENRKLLIAKIEEYRNNYR